MLSSTSVTLMSDGPQRCGSLGFGHSPGVDSMTVAVVPRMSSTPGEMCAVELDFPRANFSPGESCVEGLDYIRPTGSPVCALTVTGSLLFGSPHRRVWGRFHSTLLCLLRFDGLEVIRWSTDIQYGFHALLLVTICSRLTPDIITSVLIVSGSGSSFCGACVIAHWERYLIEHDRSEFCRCRQYLVPSWNLAWIVLIVVCLSYSVVAGSFMASGRSSEMDQAGPSASLSPLPGTFLGLALDMRSDRLYDLVPDIHNVMGLRALRPSTAIVKVMSGQLLYSGCDSG